MGQWDNRLPGKVRRRQQIWSHLWGCSLPWLASFFYCLAWFPVQGNNFSHGRFWLELEHPVHTIDPEVHPALGQWLPHQATGLRNWESIQSTASHISWTQRSVTGCSNCSIWSFGSEKYRQKGLEWKGKAPTGKKKHWKQTKSSCLFGTWCF